MIILGFLGFIIVFSVIISSAIALAQPNPQPEAPLAKAAKPLH